MSKDKINEVIDGVIELYPSAHRQALRTCAELMYIDTRQLKQQNVAILANLERLKHLITDAYRSYTDFSGDDKGAFRNIVSAVSHIVDYELKTDTQQSLSAIKAQAVRDFSEWYDRDMNDVNVKLRAKIYIRQLEKAAD